MHNSPLSKICYSQSSQPFRTHTQRSRLKDSKTSSITWRQCLSIRKKREKKNKAYHWIWFNLRNCSSKILEVSGSRGEFTHARVWQVVLLHLLRAGESKMPTRQIAMGSSNPKNVGLNGFHPIPHNHRVSKNCNMQVGPLHPLEGPYCFWEMTHIRCAPSTLHSSPSTGDSNDLSDVNFRISLPLKIQK